jgi:predicted amidohydrolase
MFFGRDGEMLDKYRKIHPFTFGEESKHYTGGFAYINLETEDFHIGFSICYDLRFPELYRFMALDKVEILINIANWPQTRIEHYKTLCKARAIENQCFFVAVNRTGSDPKLTYSGNSSVFGPMGEEMIMMGSEEEIGIVEIDLDYLQETRETFPFLDDIKLISVEDEEDED